MVDHVTNRDNVLEEIRKELVGPAPAGNPIEIKPVMRFDKWEDFNGPYCQADTGEEILIHSNPATRYGIGVLFPQRTTEHIESEVIESTSSLISAEALDEIPDPDLNNWTSSDPNSRASTSQRSEELELDLSTANSLKPSTMAVSFRVHLLDGAHLEVVATGGRYTRHTVEVTERRRRADRTWWLRERVEMKAHVPATELIGASPRFLSLSQNHEFIDSIENVDPLDLRIEILSRPTQSPDIRLLTISLVNRSSGSEANLSNEKTLFQAHLRASARAPGQPDNILPYPFPPPRDDEEQLGQEMLYRDVPVFATGHGCSADWDHPPHSGRAVSVSAESLPVVELRPTTPDITLKDGSKITAGMKELTTLEMGSPAWDNLEALIAEYESWIHDQWNESNQSDFPPIYQQSAHSHLNACRDAAQRMKLGLEYLANTPNAITAFRLANEAMYVQQIASRAKDRLVTFNQKQNKLEVDGAYRSPFDSEPGEGRGNWRAFQIAFLLANVESAGNPESLDRETVDLIWFPTGGGKTEAYLGLASFSMFLRRLQDPNDTGVNVLMRYTLRLLTTQQFERAASLICAMEEIRRRNPDQLGNEEFSIGVWVGGETTPNTRAQAVSEQKQLREARDAENPFLINKCPWCGTILGPISTNAKRKRKTFTPGYKAIVTPEKVETVILHCPDSNCPFAEKLPLYVVDEDIYEYRPSVVIGTIDKFANLSWRSDPRSLFGLDVNGNRTSSPPQLIIQDELHLITGPLGSLAGLYEPVIEHLCTDDRDGSKVRPKIVCATATTRRYREQILGLYGRKCSRLFPPPGINANDSFFAREDTSASGKIYVGIHAPGFGSYQTEWVRALAALVHSPMSLPEEERDPWWTLLLFCNSLRDMGTAHTLLDTDVRDYSQVFWNRSGTLKENRRYLSDIRELTGGLKRSQIREAIDALEATYPRPNRKKPRPVDVCLATNIIEVGVDISRLSLMAVAGQPKTTAQYIQATGRVGRDPEKPGLVLTLYGPSKPRDRSHFERFRGYHERLYAQVEPSSVTPFSAPALERAFHAALVAYVRQKGNPSVTSSPEPVPTDLIDEAIRVIRARATLVDRQEIETYDRIANKRREQWKNWEKMHWDKAEGEDSPLLRTAGSYVRNTEAETSWATMRAMRNVDSECHGWISDQYNRALVDTETSDD